MTEDKNIATPPVYSGGKEIWSCPTCGSGSHLYSTGYKANEYCGRCGQKLDWENAASGIAELCKPPFDDCARKIASAKQVNANLALKFLNEAKPIHQAVVVLHVRHDMPYARIGKIYDVSPQRISNVFVGFCNNLTRAASAEAGGIEKLNMSTRAETMLHRHGIYKMSQLLCQTEESIKKIRNIGETTANEIKQKVQEILAMPQDEISKFIGCDFFDIGLCKSCICWDSHVGRCMNHKSPKYFTDTAWCKGCSDWRGEEK